MIRLQLFGYPALFVDGEALTGPVTQRHRLALLSLLAMPPGRTLTRAKIFAMLWPDADTPSARHLLNEAVHVIRRAAGDGMIISRRDEIALSPDVEVDALRLQEGCGESGAPPADIPRAPFLDGFFLEGASEFDQWVEQQRSRLGTFCLDLLESRAAEAESSGQVADAVRLWRSLALADPYNTRTISRLMLAMERVGDHGNAIEIAKEHEALLDRDLEARPDDEFRRLVTRLRNEPAGSATQLIEGRETPLTLGDLSDANDESHPPDRYGERVTPRPTGRRRRIAILTSPIVVVFGVLFFANRPTPPVEARDPMSGARVIAVVPFVVRAPTDSLGLGDGLSDLISLALDVPGELRAADQGAVHGALRRSTDSSAAAVRRAVARVIGTERVMTGEVLQASDRLRLSVVLWQVRPDGVDSVLTTMSLDGSPNHMFSLVDDVIRGVLAVDSPDAGDRLERVADRTTESIEALKLFLAGSRAYRRAEFAKAAALFQGATDADTAFALAYYRLATASEWNWQYDRARVAAANAVAHSTRLGPTERLMAEALSLYLTGATRVVEAMLERIVAIRPEDTESWFRLAEMRFHCYAWRDRPMEDSRQAWANSLGADSGNVGALVHLVRFAALESDSTTIDRLVHRIRERSPTSDRLWEVRALQAYVGGRTNDERRLLAELIAAGDSAVLLALQGVTAFSDHVEGGRALALALRQSNNPETRKLALLRLVEVDITAGRPVAAAAWIREMSTLDSEMALVHQAYLAVLPQSSPEKGALDSLAKALRRPNAMSRRTPSNAAMGAFATIPSVLPEVHRYVEGLVAARRGRIPDVEKAEKALRALDGPTQARSLASDFALSLAARRALARGDSAEAASLLGRARLEAPTELLNSSWFYSQSAEQFLRAALALWQGHTDVALETYAAARHSRILAAPAAMAMAEIHERSGNRSVAVREYRRVARLFSHAESAQRQMADRARQRIESLAKP